MYKIAVWAIIIILLALIGYNLLNSNQNVQLNNNPTTSIQSSATNNTNSEIKQNSNNNSQPSNTSNTNNMNNDSTTNISGLHTVTLNTNMGPITIELNKDKPNTTSNFLKLVTSKFYDGVKFHRVIDGFMIQAGDPLSKDDANKAAWGTGGPGYKFNDELTGSEKYTVGTVAMANAGPNTNGSQFFIMVADVPLPPSYTVFGKVTAGLDNVLKIGKTPTDPTDKPLTAVTINSAIAK